MTTDDADVAHTIRTIANYGFAEKYVANHTGKNSRLDEIQAAALTLKLERLDADNRRRREIAALYSREIANPFCKIPYGGDTEQSVFHIYPLVSPRRDALCEHLQRRGVETLVHYPIPVHRQRAFSDYNACRLPICEKIAREEISLPLSPVQTDEETFYVIEAINQFRP